MSRIKKHGAEFCEEVGVHIYKNSSCYLTGERRSYKKVNRMHASCEFPGL